MGAAVLNARQVSPAGFEFRTNVYAETMEPPELLEPNLWRVSVFVEGRPTPAVWSRGDLGDPVHELLSLAEAGEQVDRLVERARSYGLTPRGAQALPVFTRDGRWCWSGAPLSPGSIACVRWEEAVSA